jgi:hypothetical protein
VMDQALNLNSQSTARVIETSPSSRPVDGLEGFEHRFETVGGVRLHYVTGGKPDGDVVVLLAGFPESWFAWRKIMPLLAAAYKIIAPASPAGWVRHANPGNKDARPAAAARHRSILPCRP